jgi:hypothetical protein
VEAAVAEAVTVVEPAASSATAPSPVPSSASESRVAVVRLGYGWVPIHALEVIIEIYFLTYLEMNGRPV